MVTSIIRSIAVVAVFGGLAGVRPAAASPAACKAMLPLQVRVQDCHLAAAVARALAVSPTLRKEVQELAVRHGIVYVVMAHYASLAHRDVSAALSQKIAVSGTTCLLYVTMAVDYGDRAIATLAHELYHALEVLRDPEARSEKAIAALFARIGEEIGDGVFETAAARAAGDAVLHELKDARGEARPR